MEQNLERIVEQALASAKLGQYIVLMIRENDIPHVSIWDTLKTLEPQSYTTESGIKINYVGTQTGEEAREIYRCPECSENTMKSPHMQFCTKCL